MTKPEPVTLGVDAGTAVFVPRPDSRDMEVLNEVWRDDVYAFTRDQVGFTGTVVDVGANVGAFTLLAAVGGASRVIAIEPDPDNLAALRANLTWNEQGLDRVETIQAAAWWKETRGRVVAAPGSPDAVVREDEGGDVLFTTLTRVWEDYDILGADLVKVDVEGAEHIVIAGASDDVLWSIRRLVVETHGKEILGDRPAPDDGSFGKMVERLANFFRIEIVGRPRRGGMLFCERY